VAAPREVESPDVIGPAPTLPGDDDTPTTTSPSESTTASTAPTVTSTPTAIEPTPPPASGASTFENRWFSDPDAYPQVALWGVLLSLVALGATWISRRTSRNLVGALVGVVPFVVVLYFFFENLNRLMPPSL
jgi:hypothetical protein